MQVHSRLCRHLVRHSPIRVQRSHYLTPYTAEPAEPRRLASAVAPRMTKRQMVQIGTHSGSFHCDEALGCWMLRQTGKFKDADIVRSRDPEVLKDLDVVIDVGGVYDPDTMRFDHHQRTFDSFFGNGFGCTRLSSAGLVYKHFGREVVANVLGWPIDHPDLETVYLQVYRNFIEAVDAIDNGVGQYAVPSGTAPLYLNNTTLAARVGALNPRWNQPSDDATLNSQFLKAVELTGSEFREAVDYIANCWLPGRRPVQEALAARHAIHPSGAIIHLKQVCPWKEHLYALEKEEGISGQVLFCVFQDERDQSFRVQAVSISAGSFENRKSMPAAWRGVRDDALSELSGIPGCVFVHAGGFIGGNKTLEGALQMAVKSLELE